jgi:hypothetical protein
VWHGWPWGEVIGLGLPNWPMVLKLLYPFPLLTLRSNGRNAIGRALFITLAHQTSGLFLVHRFSDNFACGLRDRVERDLIYVFFGIRIRWPYRSPALLKMLQTTSKPPYSRDMSCFLSSSAAE